MLSSQGGVTPLLAASLKGHSQVAELLLSKGADVNLPEQVQYVSTCNTCIKKSVHMCRSTTYDNRDSDQ